MLKLPLLLLALLGTSVAQNPRPDPQPISQLQGTARVLIVFAPDANSADFKRQLQLIERHSFELSLRNTVVVAVSTARGSDEHFSFENLPLANPSDQADARSRFHIQPGDFTVILLNQNGVEQIRAHSPVDIHSLTTSLDTQPGY
jgi:hypothetical protein